MLALGTQAPDFSLPDPDGTQVSLNDFQSAAGVVVIFMCNHCPFVQMLRESLAGFARECATKNIAVVAINSNDSSKYPDDSPAKMKEEIVNFGYSFPYLVDADQSVARAYRAACTPDFFLFDGNRKLFYRGQYDDARPGNGVEVTGADLRQAIDVLVSGAPSPQTQKPSIGCNIKWIPGQEPDYFNKP